MQYSKELRKLRRNLGIRLYKFTPNKDLAGIPYKDAKNYSGYALVDASPVGYAINRKYDYDLQLQVHIHEIAHIMMGHVRCYYHTPLFNKQEYEAEMVTYQVFKMLDHPLQNPAKWSVSMYEDKPKRRINNSKIKKVSEKIYNYLKDANE